MKPLQNWRKVFAQVKIEMCIRDRAKVGPKINILIADEKVFDLIPVKKEIKAEVSGLYIVGVKGIRGSLEAPQKKKKGFLARFRK